MKLSRFIAVTCFGVLVLPLLFVQAQESASDKKLDALRILLTDAEMRHITPSKFVKGEHAL